MPITVQASGVLEAPAKIETKPIAAKTAIGKGIQFESEFPKVAPVKNKGVTSPPLKPDPKVIPVNPVLAIQSYHGKGDSKASKILGTPNPI